MRVQYSFGHIFSDDAYYAYLSKTLLDLNYTNDFLGYPIYPLRINMYLFTALSFSIFGTNEFATIVFPMIFSLINVVLIYKLTLLISKNYNCSILAALLLAFFPVDIIYATINFVDSRSVFFINLGICFLFQAHIKKEYKYSIYSGIAFFISMQFKVNMFFYGLLLIILWFYLYFKHKKINLYLLIPLCFVFLNIVLEGLIYFFIYGDLLYRFHLMEVHYTFCKNDFFTLGSARGYNASEQYWPELIKLIFKINFKTVFLRRLHLFLPLIALVQSINLIRHNKNLVLIYWFLGLSFLYIAFTVSLTEYSPLILLYSYSVFPLFVPIIIISAMFLVRFNNSIKIILLLMYIIASSIMIESYRSSMDVAGLDNLKSLLRKNPDKMILADHYTGYSINLVDNYPDQSRVLQTTYSDLNFEEIKQGQWVIYKEPHIKELMSQGFHFPDYSILKTNKFIKIFNGAKFEIYEKL